MEAERIFWPVGHGGFFSEHLYSAEHNTHATIVYDCGTLKNQPLCEKRIDEFCQLNHFHKANLFSQIFRFSNRLNCLNCGLCIPSSFDNSCIDILFITHFDYDHISCIAHLATKIEIKNVVIPYYDDYDLLYLSVASINNPLHITNSDIRSALNLPQSTNIYRIVPEKEIDNSSIDYNLDHPQIIQIGDSLGSDICICSGTSFCLSTLTDWIWAVFNYDRPQNTPQIRKAIQQLIADEGLDPYDLQSLILRLNYKDIRQKINNIYTKNIGNKNNGSLVIFSSPTTPSHTLICLYTPKAANNQHICYIGKCGFVYMGDYNAKPHKKSRERLDAYLQFISPYTPLLDGIQIPHHGSAYSFSSEILTHTNWSVAAVPNPSISAKHPSRSVLHQMKSSGFSFLINETDESILIQHFHI